MGYWRAARFLPCSGSSHGSGAPLRFRQAAGLAGALRTLQHQPYGWILLGLTGLFSFGLFEIAQGILRRIDARQVEETATSMEVRAVRMTSN